MRSPMEAVPEAVIADALRSGWRLRVDALEYLPVGAGAYHWVALAAGQRWFVTCDDLDTKPWLGADRDTVFDGLTAAYRTAMDLRRRGIGAVAAPEADAAGAPAVRLDERHSLSVFEHLDGVPGRWGSAGSVERGALVDLLADLHRAPPPPSTPVRDRLELPGRADLDRAVDERDERWDSGPLAEPARQLLARHVDLVAEQLDHLDRVAAEDRHDGRSVVTHGEPHPGNLIAVAGRPVLVDWDTVALAPPERDLWMIADADAVAAYEARTGVGLDPHLLAAYRTLWALADVASYTAQLRAEHRRDADAEHALAAIASIFDGREPNPYGTRR